MHVHSSGWSTTYTPLHVATRLFADPDCCTSTYVYSLPWSCTSQRVNYTAILKYVKSHRYPKSTINIQSLLLSLQEALWALKSVENSSFLHGLLPSFIQAIGQRKFLIFLRTTRLFSSKTVPHQLSSTPSRCCRFIAIMVR